MKKILDDRPSPRARDTMHSIQKTLSMDPKADLTIEHISDLIIVSYLLCLAVPKRDAPNGIDDEPYSAIARSLSVPLAR